MAEPSRSTPPDTSLRLIAAAIAIGLAAAAFLMQGTLSTRLQGLLGIIAFIAVVCAFSRNLRAVSWRTVGLGMAIQIVLALFILKFEIGGIKPGYVFFSKIANVVKQFLEFTNAGSQFVFGPLANPATLEKGLGAGNGFVFAFTALPTIIFVS
jgi:CNT family concentrative nucleoside transporter